MRNTHLDRLSKQFIDGVLATLRKASVEELATLLPAVRQLVNRTAVKRTDQKLRAPRDTEEVIHAALDLLQATPDGLRSEELSRALAVHPARMRLALVELVQRGAVVRVGRARGVRYVVSAEPRNANAGASTLATKALATEIPATLLATIHDRLSMSAVPLTAGGLAPLLGAEKDLVRAALEQLVERGDAIRQGAGRYRGTNEDRAARDNGEEAPASGEIPTLAARGQLVTGAALARSVDDQANVATTAW